MSEEQVSYKVTDRRLFNSDGTPREVPEDEKPEPKVEVESKPAAAEAASDVAETTAESTSAPTPEPATAETAASAEADPADAGGDTDLPGTDLPGADLPGADDPASFASFLMSIASNAAASLGMMEHPVTGKREVDLELGKHWIDVLGMLQEKTRNNLLPQEKQILEGLLADLRMQYVSLSNATPKARTFSSRDITGG